MSVTWTKCHLGDIITLQMGFDLPDRLRQAGAVPIVSSSGITGYHDESRVTGPGVVTGRYGTLGEAHYVEQDFWPLNTTLFVKDFKGNFPRFISSFLRTLNFESQNVAGAVPGINRNYLHILGVKVPDRATQRIIASVLSAYDDLIANNTRRIAVLEEIAQSLYHEWFVRFRFPGHEQAQFVETDQGRVPEDWLRYLGDIIALKRGYDLPERDRMEGSIPIVSSSGITGWHNQAMVKGPGVVTGRYGTLGDVFTPMMISGP